MERWNEVRPGEEVAAAIPPANDAGLVFIGTIRTPWRERSECPRQGRLDGPVCTIELDEPWVPALAGIEACERIDVLYWLHRGRRDLLRQKRSADSAARGTFALRSPMRPNPIGVSTVRLLTVEGRLLRVQGLDCLDGTPLLDLKPERCALAHEGGEPKDKQEHGRP